MALKMGERGLTANRSLPAQILKAQAESRKKSSSLS
jgi:hypothetical protein